MTQSEVRETIEGGASTREAVTRACRAGGDCGACHGMIESMIEDHLDQHDCHGPNLVACPAVEPSSPQLIPDAALVRTRAA